MCQPLSKRRYRQPPILEAICEIHFAGQPYSKEELERLKPLWRLDYPQQNMVDEKQVEFRMDMQGTSVVEGQVGQKLICRSGDQLRLVQLSNRFLAVNQLRPYMGWEEGFRDLILARWNEVRETLGVEQIARIGLRYINRIEIPQQPLEWEEWFNFCLPLPQSFRHPSGQFHLVFHQLMTDGMRSVINIASAQPAPEGFTWVILDLDVILEKSFPPSDLPLHLERIHGPHSLAFEEYLLDKLRDRFEPL